MTKAGAPIAVSMGEPAGIGPDLILTLFADRAGLDLPPLVVYGHGDFLAARARRLGLDIVLASVKSPDDAARVDGLAVIETGGEFDDTPGAVQPQSAKSVIEAIARAVADCRAGRCRALVTAPINKAALYAHGFAYPGHTEYLAALCADGGTAPRPVMMLAHEGLRVVPLTIHEPLASVAGLVTEALIVQTVRIVAMDLRQRFGIAAPKIGVAGLNPHAGENATIGSEERDIIAPAIAALKGEGIEVSGPYPADTLFFPPHWRQYDCVVAMYHDQALIPVKTLAFDAGVNVTLGLPIIRTSPDHGTAFDLAGTGRASGKSLLAAIRLADVLSART